MELIIEMVCECRFLNDNQGYGLTAGMTSQQFEGKSWAKQNIQVQFILRLRHSSDGLILSAALSFDRLLVTPKKILPPIPQFVRKPGQSG